MPYNVGDVRFCTVFMKRTKRECKKISIDWIMEICNHVYNLVIQNRLWRQRTSYCAVCKRLVIGLQWEFSVFVSRISEPTRWVFCVTSIYRLIIRRDLYIFMFRRNRIKSNRPCPFIYIIVIALCTVFLTYYVLQYFRINIFHRYILHSLRS